MAKRGSSKKDQPTVRVEQVELHGNEVSYRRGGSGETVLFVHGIAGSCDTFDPVLPTMAEHYDVIAPDLLGHGRSAKPRGDYSLGAYASGLRDLLEVLEVDKVTVVGHSMGGGIAMQFAYQFPEKCGRLVLVSSGGLGPEVTPLLRAATLPGAEAFLSVATHEKTKRVLISALSPFKRLGVYAKDSVIHVGEHFSALGNVGNRKAFVLTARSVMDLRGQRIDARDRQYLAEALPTLIIWGRRDRFIPVSHGEGAHKLMPGSQLEIFEGAGHFPYRDDPERFTSLLLEFLKNSEPADISTEILRDTVKAGPTRQIGQIN